MKNEDIELEKTEEKMAQNSIPKHLWPVMKTLRERKIMRNLTTPRNVIYISGSSIRDANPQLHMLPEVNRLLAQVLFIPKPIDP